MNIKIFVINLKRHSARREHIISTMKKLKLDFEFIEGIDGSTLDESILNSIDQNFCIEKFSHRMNNGEIGCALSHIAAYKKIIDSKIEHAVILEDDVFLPSIFPDILDQTFKKGKNADLLFLFHGKAKSWPIKRKLAYGYRLARYRSPSKNSSRTIIGAVAYIISNAGAQRLLDLGYPIRMPADYLTGRMQWHQLKTYGVEPNCVDTGHFETTIVGRDYGSHIE